MTDAELAIVRTQFNDFDLFPTPVTLTKLCNSEEFPYVKLFSILDYEIDGKYKLIGECGEFCWKDNVVTSLDGDFYDSNMLIYGYKVNDDSDELDLLVKTWQIELEKEKEKEKKGKQGKTA